MDLVPVHLLRERRQSFVELYSYDNHGHSNYGTAGHIGNGYFVTVKHAVIALPVDDDHRITSVKVSYRGQLIPATVVDAGNAENEVDPGDYSFFSSPSLIFFFSASHPSSRRLISFSNPRSVGW
jgi:hypothetical protein